MPEINFRPTTGSLNTSSIIRYSPVKGILNSCLIHFPDGCNQLVQVYLRIRTNQILPYPARGTGNTNQGVALNNTTQRFSIGELVNTNDPIEVYVVNNDNTNSHTVSVIINVGKEGAL